MEKRVIVWFRNNLRLDDNQSLLDASRSGDVIPVYVFDERTFKGKTRDFGFRKTGVNRARFILESVNDLKERLLSLGSDLVIRVGKPEEEITKIAEELRTSWVFCNRERTDEEVKVQDELESRLWNIGQELRFARGKMLYHTGDLPFPVTHTPDVFTQYRKEVERIVPVRDPIDPPSTLNRIPEDVALGELPTLESLGFTAPERDERAVLPFVGGETAALARLNYYLWESDLAKTYKETRNELVGQAYSTKLSPWLAAGCISPKRIYSELKRYEAERGANESTYWIFFELLWRDFFRLIAKKYRNKIFQVKGPKELPIPDWSENERLFKAWATGETGVPFIDANMRELNATGFMSNRGRQNVASFLVKDLKINWQLGAEYFESKLIDYDVASNWCNWNYIAGVGTDPREDRYFNILSQAKRYDPNGTFVKHWIPALNEVSSDKIHRPDELTQEEQRTYKVQLGVTYPNAILNIGKWAGGGGPERNKKFQSKKGNRGSRRGFAQFDY